jgi:catalase
VSNIVTHASADVSDDVQRRVIGYWTNVDAELGARVAAGLGKTDGSGNGAATLADTAATPGGAR